MIASPSILNVPSADCCMNEVASPNVSLLVEFSVSPVPSVWVRVVSPSAPSAMTAESDNSLTSSPATISFATDKPPSVCNEPSVVDVASVASSVFTITDATIGVQFTVINNAGGTISDGITTGDASNAQVNGAVPSSGQVSIADNETFTFIQYDADKWQKIG